MKKQNRKRWRMSARVNVHLSTGVITISVIAKMYAHTYAYVRTCNMLMIELMPTLLKLSRLSIRRTNSLSRQAKERKLVDQLESHVHPIATIESNTVMYFSNKQYLHEVHRKREKKWHIIDRKKKDVRAGSIYINCVYNLFDVSMNAMWINKIPWNKQAVSYFFFLSNIHTHTHRNSSVSFHSS
jgi:hypothetical protein